MARHFLTLRFLRPFAISGLLATVAQLAFTAATMACTGGADWPR